jgi:Leucine-rich repeat (LRR) protein
MFIKKDPRKIPEILVDKNDKREQMLLARRIDEFEGTTKSLFRTSNLPCFKNLINLSLYGNKLTELKGIHILKDSPLEELNLGGNLLSKLPEEFSALQVVTSLKSIWLDDNCLTSVPEPLFALNNIVHLRLSGNKIESLSKKIVAWTALETLALDNNGLKKLPTCIGRLSSLKALILRGNKLKELPEPIGKMKSLNLLHCSSNELEDIPDFFSGMTSLAKFYGGANKIQRIPVSMATSTSLVQVSLINNRISEIDAIVAERWLDENGKPKSGIQLKGNKFLKARAGGASQQIFSPMKGMAQGGAKSSKEKRAKIA